MRRTASWMCGVFLLSAGATMPGSLQPALAHPDFSGSWSLDVSKSEGQNLPSAATVKVTQTENSMTVEQTVTREGRTSSRTETYKLDGSPSKNTRGAGATSVEINSTAEWSENVLVIKLAWDFGGRSFSGTDRYSLSDDKKTLTIAREALLGDATVSMKQSFVRQ